MELLGKLGLGAVGRAVTDKAGILVRVSDPGQHTDNQLSDLLAWAERRGLEVITTYQFQESAWKGAHQKQLTQVYQDARAGKFQVLLVWALDRLSREGPLGTLEIVHRLGQSGVQVWSYQEPWTEAGGELLDLFLTHSLRFEEGHLGSSGLASHWSFQNASTIPAPQTG